MLPPILFQAHRVGKDRQGIGFREVGDGIDVLSLQQLIDLGFRRHGKALAKLLHHGRRQDLAEHGAGARMRRRIGLQDQARRPPWLLGLEIAQAHAAAGAEGEGIVEHGMDLGAARHAVDVPFVEKNNRGGFPEPLL